MEHDDIQGNLYLTPIVGIGEARNPDVIAKVPHDLIIGSSTEPISCETLIVTAGTIDAHVYFMYPQQVTEALANEQPATCTPSLCYTKTMLAATDMGYQ